MEGRGASVLTFDALDLVDLDAALAGAASCLWCGLVWTSGKRVEMVMESRGDVVRDDGGRGMVTVE